MTHLHLLYTPMDAGGGGGGRWAGGKTNNPRSNGLYLKTRVRKAIIEKLRSPYSKNLILEHVLSTRENKIMG